MSQIAVSLALIREEFRVQRLVYYTSKAFQGAEVKYLRIEKIAFSLIVIVDTTEESPPSFEMA